MLMRTAISFGPGVVTLRYIWYCDPEFFLLARPPCERCMRILARPPDASPKCCKFRDRLLRCLPAACLADRVPACLLACLRASLFSHARRCRPSLSMPALLIRFQFFRSLCCARARALAVLLSLSIACLPAPSSRFCPRLPACAMIDDWRVPLRLRANPESCRGTGDVHYAMLDGVGSKGRG